MGKNHASQYANFGSLRKDITIISSLSPQADFCYAHSKDYMVYF